MDNNNNREDERLLDSPLKDKTINGDETEATVGSADEKIDAFKIGILLAISFMTFGSYWCFDIPGSIQTQLTDWFGGPNVYSKADNANLYSVYSYPNVILAFFGGFLIDRLGTRFGATLFCSLVLAGQIVFSLGVQFKLYWVCILGRFIFGLGGESLTVAQNTFTARWFAGKNIAVFFGVVVSVSRIGSSINFAVTPQLAKSGVPTSVWVGTATTVISLLSCFIAVTMDWRGRHRVKEVSADEKISLSHARHFPLASWIIFLICVFFYVAILTFYTVASSILQNIGLRLPHYTPDEASFFIFIPNFVSIFASPLFGRLVDSKGYSLLWIFEASCMLCFAHLAFVLNATDTTNISPIPIFIWLGLAYSLGAAAMWPMLQYIIEPKALGTAYGIMTAMQNAGLAVFPEIVGAIQGHTSPPAEYTLPLILFMFCALTASALALFLFVIDLRRHRGIMNAPALVRKELQKEMFGE